MKNFFVYIITNKSNKVLYTGVTSNLEKRTYEHKNKILNGFSKKYNLTKLVYFNQCDNATSAIEHEKKIKGISRDKKIKLITQFNKEWKDLSRSWT